MFKAKQKISTLIERAKTGTYIYIYIYIINIAGTANARKLIAFESRIGGMREKPVTAQTSSRRLIEEGIIGIGSPQNIRSASSMSTQVRGTSRSSVQNSIENNQYLQQNLVLKSSFGQTYDSTSLSNNFSRTKDSVRGHNKQTQSMTSLKLKHKLHGPSITNNFGILSEYPEYSKISKGISPAHSTYNLSRISNMGNLEGDVFKEKSKNGRWIRNSNSYDIGYIPKHRASTVGLRKPLSYFSTKDSSPFLHIQLGSKQPKFIQGNETADRKYITKLLPIKTNTNIVDSVELEEFPKSPTDLLHTLNANVSKLRMHPRPPLYSIPTSYSRKHFKKK